MSLSIVQGKHVEDLPCILYPQDREIERAVADLVETFADRAWSAHIRTNLPNQAYRLASEEMIPALDHLP